MYLLMGVLLGSKVGVKWEYWGVTGVCKDVK